jgi:hypothetical protein
MLSHFFEQMINFIEIIARFLVYLSDLLRLFRDNDFGNYGFVIFVCVCLAVKNKKKRLYES